MATTTGSWPTWSSSDWPTASGPAPDHRLFVDAFRGERIPGLTATK